MSGFLQLSLQVDRDQAPTVTEILSSLGALSVTIESACEDHYFDTAAPGDAKWHRQSLTAIYQESRDMDEITQHIVKSIDHELTAKITQIPDQDWERVWLDRFHPEKVGNNLWICPSWCDPPQPEQINLVIDPGLAFGTGTHETTRLCLQYLSKFQLHGKNVIDFGCGSGILGIAALKLGAQSVVAVDVDPRAVSTAVENARINDVADKFLAIESSQCDCGVAELVVANILAGTLIESAPALKSATASNGTLVLSGILDTQEDIICEVYQDSFQFERFQTAPWLMLAGSKR